MNVWFKKKTGAGGQAQGGGGSEGLLPPVGARDGRQQQQQSQRNASLTQPRQVRRGSFLDAVGGAMGRGTRKKDVKSEATALAEQLDARRAEKISSIAFKLVREIQRILKEARETQTAAAAAGGGGGSTRGKGAASRTPTAAPPVPFHKDGGVGVAPADSGESKTRWAGTDELLMLLDGGSPGGGGEVEDRVQQYGSMAEVQAKMSDLVEQALVPESHGDLCGQLLEWCSGEGHHPAFVKLCVDAGLPSNLVHCLRIMRVVEFESAMHEGGVDKESENSEAPDGSSRPLSTENVDAVTPDRPQTQRATQRIGRLLVTLCGDKSAGVGEQIKPHLPGLLSLAVSAYPPNGAHVQETARDVVEALMAGSLNSSMVWLLHYNKAMVDVVGEMRHLCGLDEGTNSKSPTRKGARGYSTRSVSPVHPGSRKRSPRRGTAGNGGGSGSSHGKDGTHPPVTELLGEAAEARGLWLVAVKATVSTVRFASRFVPSFVQDFESAGGYEIMAYMVRKSSIERVPAMLEQVCLLVSATSTGGVDQAALAGGSGAFGTRPDPLELVASNPSAFGIIQSLLAECTPPVEAVCLQGMIGRVSSGTCDVSCLTGGYGLADQGLDTEDAVVMVAERAVAMRLDRWARDHGMLPDTAPVLLSIGSSGTEDDDDENSGGFASEDSSRSGSHRGRAPVRVSVGGAGEVAADVGEADEFRLRLLEAVLGLYSNHPINYGELETKFHALSFFLCALPYYENRELKGLALKTLEVICVSFKDVHPRDALHSTSTAFTVCLDHMIGLLSDPLSSPGIGRKVSLVGGSDGIHHGVGLEEDRALGVSIAATGDIDGDGGSVGIGGWGIEEYDAKVAAALRKAEVLLEDADMMRRMLEKLLEFDEKKYTAMFQATGILDQVLHPLLKRVLTLNVGGCPGAAETWRAMRQPHGLAAGGGSGAGEVGSGRRVEETGALALVSRATRLLCGTLALLLGSSQGVCRQFRALRMHDTLYNVIRDFGPTSSEAALAALERASASEPSGVPEDMAFLIELVQGSKSRAERWRQAAALMGLRSILLCKHQAVKDVWRESCGFEAALAAISSLDSAFSLHSPAGKKMPTYHYNNESAPTLNTGDDTSRGGDNESSKYGVGVRRGESGDRGCRGPRPSPAETRLMEAEHFGVIQAALLTLVASASAGPLAVVRGERLVGYRANRRYLRREISYDSLACCLVNSGVVASPAYAGPAVKLLFTMVTELPCENMTLELESGLIESAGVVTTTLGAGSNAAMRTAAQTAMETTVRNADAVMVILSVLPYLSEEVAWASLGALNTVVRAGGFAEAEALVVAGAVRKAADVLATALHVQATAHGKKYAGASLALVDAVDADGPSSSGAATVAKSSHVSSMADRRKEMALRDGQPDVLEASRGAVAALSAPLRLTERVQRRLVEFLVLVASRNMTQVDLAPVIRSVTLPLVMDARGHAAPPTVLPAELALPLPSPSAAATNISSCDAGEEPTDGAVWLPGWGTFIPPPLGDHNDQSRGGGPWPWLGVLTAMSACAEDSAPFSRLGGSPETDMSSLCHEVSGARAGTDNASGSVGSGGNKGSTLWQAQQKALVETVIEEGLRMLHVPGLEGNTSAGIGDGGGGISGGAIGSGISGSGGIGGGSGGGGEAGASWPGPAGYSFACWMRFNPPRSVGAKGGFGEGRPEVVKAWGEDARRAAMKAVATGAAVSAAMAEGGGEGVGGGKEPSEIDLEAADEGLVESDDAGSAAAADKISPNRSRGVSAAATTPDRDGSFGQADKRTSIESSSSRCADGDDDGPFPHPPDRQVLWVFALASPDGRAFLQLLLDLDSLRFCLRGSSIRGEVRFNTPKHLVCGGPRTWHHVLFTHARPKSRLLGTRDKLSLWVDGELVDTVKVEAMNFMTTDGPPSAYLGCPHPQAFLDPSVGGTVAPAWHLGPCLLLTEVVDIAPYMFALGPEYTGLWTAESPLTAVSSANATRVLRHLQALGGAAGFAAIGGDVPNALVNRGLRELDRCFNVTERAYYWSRADRAVVADSFYLLLAPEQITFAYNTRHMERPGGPPAAAAAGGVGGFQIPTDFAKGARGGRGGGDSIGSSSSSISIGGGGSIDAANDSCWFSQVPATAKRAAISSSLVSGWLFNTARETAPPSAGPGPVACAYGSGVAVVPSGLPRELSGAKGPFSLFPLLQRAQTEEGVCWTLRLIRSVVRGGGVASTGYMQSGGGYAVLAGLLRSRRALLGRCAMRTCFEMAVDRSYDSRGGACMRKGFFLEESSRGGKEGVEGEEADEDRPWHGADKGFGDPEARKAEERRTLAWGWEGGLAFPGREEIDALLGEGGGAAPKRESEGKSGLSPFVLLTDPYALKNVVMNHQVWGLENRALMMDMMQLVHSLVSPHNSKPNCRFNARILHRIGLFRTGLHFLLEASEPLPPPPTVSSRRAESSSPATPTLTQGLSPDLSSNLSPVATTATATATVAATTRKEPSPSPRPALAIAAFGGKPRPTAAVAAAGLDTRDAFMASCALLLQRVLAVCAIQKDFDRVVGATLSTLADGGAAAREVRSPGSEPAFVPAEAALREAGLLGDGGCGSAGDRVLSGQAIVRLYLLRVLLEIVTLPVAAASRGKMDASEGLYVAGVGSPCAKEAQCVAEVAEALLPGGEGTEAAGRAVGGDENAKTRLEQWLGGVPPVVDMAEDGRGLPSPLYVGRHKVFRAVCSRALRADWFISLLETCREEAGMAWTFRLLAAMLQSSEDFVSSFQKADGYRVMAACLSRHSVSLPVLLPALALATGVPVAALPVTAEGMDAVNILSLLRRNAGMALGPGGSAGRSGGGEPRAFVTVCVAGIILPSLRDNAALLRHAEASGLVASQARSPPPPPSTLFGSGRKNGRRSDEYSLGTSEERDSSRSIGAGETATVEAGEYQRAKRVNEVISAALWEALMNDASFRLTCRSPGVVEALVDVLGGTWDEPEEVLVDGEKSDDDNDTCGEEEIQEPGGSGSGSSSGDGRSSASGESSAEGFPPQASPHPPAELLRIVIADIVATGGSEVFPSLARVFASGAAVMGPVIKHSSPVKRASLDSTARTRDLSPLGREPGSASAGVFQRAMLRHLEACCRDAIALAMGAGMGSAHNRWTGISPPKVANAPLKRALESLAAVAAVVAEAAAEGLLPGVETGHLAVGLVLSVLRQISSASVAVSGGGADGLKMTTLGACQIATVVALRRAVQRESGGGRVESAGLESLADGSTSGVAHAGRRRLTVDRDGNDLLEECLLMIAHNLDALLVGDRRSASASGGGGFSGLSGGLSPATPLPPRPPPVLGRSPVSPKPRLRSPVSSSTTPRNDRAGGDGLHAAGVPPPLDLSSTGLEATMEAPLTFSGMFADTPPPRKWSSRFDFPDEVMPTGVASLAATATAAAEAADEAARMNLTFSALELPSMGSSVGSASGGVSKRPPPVTTVLSGTPLSSGRSPASGKSLWESAAAGAAGLVAAADRGGRGGGGSGGIGIEFGAGGSGSGGGTGGGVGGGSSSLSGSGWRSGSGSTSANDGMREALVYRLRGSTDRAFVAGFVAELRGLLLSDSDRVRKLATWLAGALLSRRRAAVQELLGEELINTGFSMLEHPHLHLNHEQKYPPGRGDAPLDPGANEDEVAEARAHAFALWLTGGGQEAAFKEGFDRASDRAYALIPHVSSAEGLMAALTRAEMASANGGVESGFGFGGVGGNGGGGGDTGSSALSRLGSGVGGAFGALGGPNRKTITVDRAIQRADMIARTYERVATSHGRWIWAGADDLAWASRSWRVQLGGLRGEVSLWEGGLLGRLMRSSEAIPALGPWVEGVEAGLEEERYKLDMDEGPERKRLKLRPNRAFYDTYEVLSPATLQDSASTAFASSVGESQTAEKATLSATPPSPAAATHDSAVEGEGLTSGGDGAAVVVGDDDGVEAVEVEGHVAGPVAAEIGSDEPLKPMAQASQAAEGENVAEAITAIVKTMSASVGGAMGGSGGGGGGGVVGEKQQLTSVYDLDDTDCSALQELEDLNLDVSDGTEFEGPQSRIGDADKGRSTCSSTENGDQKSGTEDVITPGSAGVTLAAASTAGAAPESSTGGVAVADKELEGTRRVRAQDRGFSLSESEIDEEYDDMSTTNESVLEFDSDEDEGEQGEESQGSGCDERGGDEGGSGNVDQRGRSTRKGERSSRPPPLSGEGDVEKKAAAGQVAHPARFEVDCSGEDREAEGGNGDSHRDDGVGRSGGGVGGPVDGERSPALPSKAAVPSPAPSGPGAVAREEGWSDRELLVGLVEPEDMPVMASHDVSRSVGGVEVKRGLLLVCRHSLYFVSGFGREPPLPKPGAPSLSPTAAAAATATAAAAAAAAGRSKDPLHGVRRLEKWELGGGAGGIGGVDDDGETSGDKMQVTLRRKSAAAEITGAGGGKGGGGTSSGGVSTPVRGDAIVRGDVQDEILALGRVGVQRFLLDQVHAVYKRRYQLRDVGLEVFDVFGRSLLVSFSTQAQQEDVLTFLLARGLPASIFAKGKSKLRLAAGSSHAQARAAYKKFMQAERIDWTKKWQSGRCTNFAYLMALNTLAGRSFNDLTQYPVFPWVLCDYTSEELNLDDPRVYRDLSKPMGAIGEARSRQFTERYAAVIEAAEETGREPNPPPFHYGTHYSCAGYILHYLLRLEPFTRLALVLQGGRFDKADRLFRDIRSSWESASSENLQDVRELTPEFYTLPEFLVNSNGFDLGFTQKGQAVNHVVLPPWAKGDPGEFIRLHRKALESPTVSRTLHSWIGLIFGCKQRGPEAVEAQNVFVHLTYEGEVDIDSIQDPLLREAALAQIHNFGQTPSLVLKKAHPEREMPPVVRVSAVDGSRSADPAAVEWHASLTPPLCIVGAPDAVALEAVSITSLSGAWHIGIAGGRGGVGDACLFKDKIVGVGLGALMHPRFPDKYIRFGGPSCGLSYFQNVSIGVASSSKASYDRLLSSHQALHLAPITALACSEDGNLLLTGAADGTCRLWSVTSLHRGSGQPTNTLALMASLGWHAGRVTCASMCMGSGSAVTGGTDGKVLVWDIRRKLFVRELPGHRGMITSVGINATNGNVVTLSGSELGVWTVNGRLLASCSVTALRRGALPTFAISTDCADWQDGVVAVTGHENGDVSLWGIQWSGSSPPRSSPARRLGTGSRDTAGGGVGPIESPGRVGWSGSQRPLRLLRVLSGVHEKRVTFVRVCDGTREMLVGDAGGTISRWQCIRLDLLRSEDLNRLV